MQLSFLFAILAIMVAFLVFLPDIMPFCLSCKKYKLRPFFKIHRYESIFPGYHTSKSICKKCCRKYEFNTLSDYYSFVDARRKAIKSVDLSGQQNVKNK